MTSAGKLSNSVAVLDTIVLPIIFLVLSLFASSDSESPNATTLFTITLVPPPAVADPLNLKLVPLISAVKVIRLLLPEKTSLYVVIYAFVPSCVTNASMLLVSPVP